MSIADRIAEKVGAKYKAGDSDDNSGDDAEDPRLACARDAIRAVKANDPKAFLAAMDAMDQDSGEPPPDVE